MHSLPLFHRIAGERVVVIGDGEMAAAKRRLIERAGGICCDETVEARLAFVALEDAVQAEMVAARFKARGLLVNVADRPELCDFTLPSVLERGEVLVAVSTGGASAGLAKHLRLRLEALLPPSLAELAARLAASRDAMRTRWPTPAERRRAVDAALAQGGALDPFDPGSPDRIADWLQGDIANVADATVSILLRSDDPDDLTLREARLLGTADTIVHDATVPAAILSRARADARRVPASEVPPAAFEGLTLIVGNPQVAQSDVWFHYTKRAGRFTAAPVSTVGWMVFIAALAAIVGATLLATWLLSPIHPALGIAISPLVLVAGLFGMMRLATARGRRVE